MDLGLVEYEGIELGDKPIVSFIMIDAVAGVQ